MSEVQKTCTVILDMLNYGAFLQTYALQQFLGKSNYILSLATPWRSHVGTKGRRKLPFFWRLVALRRYLRRYFRNYNVRKKYFNEINMLNFICKYSSVREAMKNPVQADIYIAGSDQIWNPSLINEMENIYFLQFVQPTAKRISYAASLGMQKWPEEFEQKALPWLKNFHAISVREESSVEYLHSLGLNAVCTCDPTILHKADFYRKKFNSRISESDNYIFIYKIRVNIQFFGNNKTIVVNFKNKKSLVSINEWLSLIDNAEFVLTDSFHCVVFCILFHKQFAVFQNKGKEEGMNERFATILGKTNLEYRLLQDTESESEIFKIVKTPIDWERVDAILDEWRNYSKNWLMEAIK